jgi:hypothetical protein
MDHLLPPMLEHAAGGLAARYAALKPGGLPPESLAQYFLDLVWLDGVISAAGERVTRGRRRADATGDGSGARGTVLFGPRPAGWRHQCGG